MIQRMGRARRKGVKQATFVLLTPKWTQVSGPKEIEKRIKKRTNVVNASSDLSDANQPKASKRSPLNQEVDVNKLSKNESVANFEPDDEFVDQATEQLFDLLITEAKDNAHNQKIKK